LFIILPLGVLGALLAYYLKTDEFSTFQRWAVCGIIGGGFGNLIDRIFRPNGVVDFVSVNFYGLFGLSRWPTFNVADSSVVVCGIILFASVMFAPKTRHEEEKA
jgi:signal peptidase II